jgi:hypothetical protein
MAALDQAGASAADRHGQVPAEIVSTIEIKGIVVGDYRPRVTAIEPLLNMIILVGCAGWAATAARRSNPVIASA